MELNIVVDPHSPETDKFLQSQDSVSTPPMTLAASRNVIRDFIHIRFRFGTYFELEHYWRLFQIQIIIPFVFKERKYDIDASNEQTSSGARIDL